MKIRQSPLSAIARWLSFLQILLGFAGATQSAWAHLMPAQQGTLNIVDNAVFSAISIPVSALPGIDDDGDGRLSIAEWRAHKAEIIDRLRKRLRLFDGAQEGRTDMIQALVEPDERSPTSKAGATYFLVLMKTSFASAPKALRMEADLFGKAPGERQLTIKATRGSDAEAVVLSPGRIEHRFFRAPWQVLTEYLKIGVEHILFGADHLLFLLTIIVATAGWRYWLGVLTSFTVAHSITLTLSLLGLIHASAALVEPLIAASIVVMASLNLFQRGAAPSQRMCIVFACGLLHGVGFASSLSDMGLHGSYRFMSLIGFNLGIELGQTIFLISLLGFGCALNAIRRFAPFSSFNIRLSGGKLASLVAALVGTFWFIERVAVAV